MTVATDKLIVEIRPATLDEIPLVRQTWHKSFAESSFARSMDVSTYSKRWWKVIDDLLARGTLLVACSPEHPDLVLGWLVCELNRHAGPTLHYAYVKSGFRLGGVATALLEAAGLNHRVFSYTHRTTDAQRITSGWDTKPTYDPALCWEH